jgi:hypothetical protein
MTFRSGHISRCQDADELAIHPACELTFPRLVTKRSKGRHDRIAPFEGRLTPTTSMGIASALSAGHQPKTHTPIDLGVDGSVTETRMLQCPKAYQRRSPPL